METTFRYSIDNQIIRHTKNTTVFRVWHNIYKCMKGTDILIRKTRHLFIGRTEQEWSEHREEGEGEREKC